MFILYFLMDLGAIILGVIVTVALFGADVMWAGDSPGTAPWWIWAVTAIGPLMTIAGIVGLVRLFL
jgi:hypothetical protein